MKPQRLNMADITNLPLPIVHKDFWSLRRPAMGMSCNVYGYSPPNETFNKMRDVYTACKNAGVAVPESVLEFFNYSEPDPAGVSIVLHNHSSVKAYTADMRSGYEVDLAKLPPGVKILRFVNSW